MEVQVISINVCAAYQLCAANAWLNYNFVSKMVDATYALYRIAGSKLKQRFFFFQKEKPHPSQPWKAILGQTVR